MNNIPIVTDIGHFDSVITASQAERVIDWWDESNPDAVVCTQCYAAVELRKYLCLMTGCNPDNEANFPLLSEQPETDAIVINTFGAFLDFAGFENSYNKSSNENYLIKTINVADATYLTLSGKGREGTLYAVYAFLETLGFRFFGTGKKGTFIPHTESFKIPTLDIKGSTSFKTRGCYSELIDDSDTDFIEWLGRNRINFAYLDRINNPHSLKKRGIRLCAGGHETLERYLNPKSRYPYSHKLFGGEGRQTPIR